MSGAFQQLPKAFAAVGETFSGVARAFAGVGAAFAGVAGAFAAVGGAFTGAGGAFIGAGGSRRGAVVAVMVGLACSASGSQARAGWSSAIQFAHSTDPTSVTVGIDARGDAAVAWAAGPGGSAGSGVAVRVATRRGWRGRWETRTLRSAKGLRAADLALAMARGGGLTVAWIDKLPGRHSRLRAAFMSAKGRWSAVQDVAAGSGFSSAYVRLAVGHDGTVALAYNARSRVAKGMAIAWRRPGHGFGRVRAVPGGPLSEPALAIDAQGSTVLAGTALCENETFSHGVWLTAPARTHRFGAPRSITPHPATQVRFVSTAPGHGVVAWVEGGCSTTELLSGHIWAARVDRFGAHDPVTLDPSFGSDPSMFAVPEGVELTWTSLVNPRPTAMLAHGSSEGAFDQPRQPADGWLPVAADGHGDLALQSAAATPASQMATVAARPAGSSSVRPVPIEGPALWVSAGAGDGGGLIVATRLVGTLRVATWRP